jgi:hypothetical protein
MPEIDPEEAVRIKAARRQQEARDRRAANVFLLIAAAAFIGIGVWIGEGLLRAKRADDCISSGRRNCNPIEVPAASDPPRRIVDPRP